MIYPYIQNKKGKRKQTNKKTKMKKENQQSLGRVLEWVGVAKTLFLTSLDIWPLISLHTFSNSITLFCILCKFIFTSLLFSSAKLWSLSRPILYNAIWGSIILSLGFVFRSPNTLVVGTTFDCCEISACIAILGGILGFFASSLQASRLSFW